MLQAPSHIKSSQGSSVATYLNSFLGIEVSHTGASKKADYKKLVAGYQKELEELVDADPAWNSYSGLLFVYIDKSDSIKIGVRGGRDLKEEVNLIEFGTGQQPARPLMRNAEARFNSNFDWRKTFKS